MPIHMFAGSSWKWQIELTSVTSSSKEFGKYSYIIRTWNFLNLASQSTTPGNHLSLLFGNHTKLILQMAEHQQMEELLGDKHLEVRGNKKEVTYYLTTERHSLIVNSSLLRNLIAIFVLALTVDLWQVYIWICVSGVTNCPPCARPMFLITVHETQT